MAYRIPNDGERRAFLAYLLQASSFTAWERIVEQHREFVDRVRDAYEDHQKNPPAHAAVYIATSELSHFLQCHSALRKALELLGHGERRCFRWLGAPGHFSEGMRWALSWREENERWLHMGGAEFPPSNAPEWPTLEAELNVLIARYNEVMIVLEPRFTDVPAPLYRPEQLSNFALGKALLARTELPAVPTIDPPVLVRSGAEVPHFGVWEPVSTPSSRGELVPSSTAQLLVTGCMNYLHQGAPAPTIAFDGDSPRRVGRATYWRLIFIDDRYSDGTIPDSENDYEFMTP